MIGDMLRAEREKQNLTLKDVEKGTSIRALYIESIEAGDYSKLPGEVYTKGFIRNYANFLKMDASQLLKQYTAETHPEAAAAAREDLPAAGPSKESPVELAAKKKVQPAGAGYSTGEDFRQRVESSHKKQNMWLVAAVVLAVAGGAYYLLSSDESVAPKKAPTVTQQAKAPQAEPAQPAVPEKKVEGVELAAKFTDRCWTQVVVDGKTVYEGTMEKGKSETWKGKEKIVITAGNASAVDVKWNGKDQGELGDRGQVVEKTYTPDGPVADNTVKKDKDSKK